MSHCSPSEDERSVLEIVELNLNLGTVGFFVCTERNDVTEPRMAAEQRMCKIKFKKPCLFQIG